MRGLGLWAGTAIVIGSMIGQAVFLVASDMSREVGSATTVLIVWIVGGVVVLFGACCYAELGAAVPEAGGDYIYLRRGLSPVLGFLYGWTSALIMQPGSAAVIAAGLMRFVGFLWPSVTTPLLAWSLRFPFQPEPHQFTFTATQPLAAVAVVIVMALNYLGVRTVGRFEVFLTALKVAAVAAILALGLMARSSAGAQPAFIASPVHGIGSGPSDSPRARCDGLQRISVSGFGGRRGTKFEKKPSANCDRRNGDSGCIVCPSQLGVLSRAQFLSSSGVPARCF